MSKSLDELEAELEAAGDARETTHAAHKAHCEIHREAIREMHRLSDADKWAGEAVVKAREMLVIGYAEAMRAQRKAMR